MPLLVLCTSNWTTSQTLRSIEKDDLCSLETGSMGLTVYYTDIGRISRVENYLFQDNYNYKNNDRVP